VAKAKTEKLVLTQHGNDAIPPLLEAFTKKYGIQVEQTAARPSRMLSRIRVQNRPTAPTIGTFGWPRRPT
jgi:hypothetical protein